MLVVKDEIESIEEIKKQENTYIYNIDAHHLYRAMMENISNKEGKIVSKKGNYSTKTVDPSLLFIATIPYSLEMIRLDKIYDREIYKLNKKQYTKAIVNVTFNENYIKWTDKIDIVTGEVLVGDDGNPIRSKSVVAKKKKMRKYLYQKGFMIDGQKYIFYKRGASKARTGSCLFIKEEMYKPLMDRSRLIHNKSEKGLYFKEGEECDITSLNAYQSLILSGLEDIIEIQKESILIIDDINSNPFEVTSSVTREINGVLETKDEKVTRINNMTDGQALGDESLFRLAEREDKGMMLLRSDMFKSCVFNTKLQQFFEYADKKGWIKDGKIKDKYRGWIDYKKILLVTTPSSVKYLKFKNKFENENECYMEWFNNIDNTFGIVKSDKPGNYGTWNRTTYQIINSMPFSKENIRELMKDELEYIRLLRTDISYFKNHISINEKATKKLESDIDELDWDNEDFVDSDEIYSSGEMMNNILSINSDFQYTKIFKQWRKNQINCYINELRKGKVRLKNTIYSTIVANPYEMLLHTIGKFDGSCIAKGYEIYCKYYENNKELATFRNPHINSGNVMLATNIWHDEYRWFNLSNNITIVNVGDNDFPDRGQGFDYDSDTLLHISHEVFVEISQKCQRYKTPLNMVKGDSKKRHNTPEELAELDDVLSNNFIGKIINKSQIINSYMWNCKKNGKDKKLIKKLYDISSMLSSLSQIELDKAKKSFDNISMAKELKNINDMSFDGENVIDFEIEYLYEEIVNSDTREVIKKPILDTNGNHKCLKKMIVPRFFEYVAQDNTYRKLIKFETPMDYLQEVIEENRNRHKRKSRPISDIMVKAKTLEGIRNMSEQHENILSIVSKYNNKINSMRINKTFNTAAKNTIIRNSKNDCVEILTNMKINQKTMYSIINKCFSNGRNDTRYSRIGMFLLNSLYKSHTLKMLGIFKNNNNKNENVLIKSDDGDICIFGDKYIKTRRINIIKP